MKEDDERDNVDELIDFIQHPIKWIKQYYRQGILIILLLAGLCGIWKLLIAPTFETAVFEIIASIIYFILSVIWNDKIN